MSSCKELIGPKTPIKFQFHEISHNLWYFSSDFVMKHMFISCKIYLNIHSTLTWIKPAIFDEKNKIQLSKIQKFGF